MSDFGDYNVDMLHSLSSKLLSNLSLVINHSYIHEEVKGSEFFRNFPGSDLAGVASLTEVVHARKGEVVFEQGDEGDAYYIVVQGSIHITRGATRLAKLGSREGFGEMSILDKESRSASATAAEDTTLLALDRDSFDRIIEQNPVIARSVYPVLTERLRNTLIQVAADEPS